MVLLTPFQNTSFLSLRHVLKLGIPEHSCNGLNNLVIDKIKKRETETLTQTYEVRNVLPLCFIRLTCCGVFHVPGFSMCSTLHFPEWDCTAGLDAARG